MANTAIPAKQKIEALRLVAGHLGLATNLGGLLGQGLQYLGVAAGCDHVIRDGEGRLFRADLVVGQVSLCVGYAPRLGAV